MPETERQRAKRTKTMPWKWLRCDKCGRQCTRYGHGRDGLRQCPSGGVHRPGRHPGPNGAAEECSAERPRAHQRQGVAPAEGRAWETPQTRTV